MPLTSLPDPEAQERSEIVVHSYEDINAIVHPYYYMLPVYNYDLTRRQLEELLSRYARPKSVQLAEDFDWQALQKEADEWGATVEEIEEPYLRALEKSLDDEDTTR